MNNYFLTLILNPDLEEKERGEVLDGVKKKLTSGEGKVEKEHLWGSRDLAYKIEKNTKGYYVHLEFSSEPKLIKDLDKSLKLEEDIIRYLLVRVKSKVNPPAGGQKLKTDRKKTKKEEQE